jgi:diacylglycerol kinase (ATP)
LIINNPVSGHSKKPEEIREITEKLKTKYDVVDVCSTTETLNAEEISQKNSDIYDLFVVLGGDGTFNETLRGVAGKEKRPTIGYIPCGTVNDFARSNGIPFNYKEAVEVILDGKIVSKSAMFINGIPSAYLVGAGIFTCVSYTANQNLKRKIGKLAYYLDILFRDKGRHGEQLEITLDDNETHKSLYSFVAGLNNSYVGGLHLSHLSFDNDDSFYAVLAKRKKGVFNLIISLFSMLRAYIKKVENVEDTKHIVVRRVNKMSVKSLSNTVWNIDGEKGPEGNAEITYKKDQFEIILKKD